MEKITKEGCLVYDKTTNKAFFEGHIFTKHEKQGYYAVLGPMKDFIHSIVDRKIAEEVLKRVREKHPYANLYTVKLTAQISI